MRLLVEYIATVILFFWVMVLIACLTFVPLIFIVRTLVYELGL